MASTPIVLEGRHLGKSYSGVPAVEDVSFQIRSGEVLGYLGPNGAGKSTTVKMLTGLLEPSSGHAFYRGERIQNDLAAYKRRLGYVPEEANLYPFLTGLEYLDLAGTLRGIPRRLLDEKSKALLEAFSMYPHRHSAIASYSKGMRQRILLMAALLDDPEVLILDEPFSGLDVTFALVFRKVVRLLAERGKAIFFCSHVLEVVEKVCTHLLVLNRGRVAAYGSMAEIRASAVMPALEDTFLRLTEQIDADRIAAGIVDSASAPAR